MDRYDDITSGDIRELAALISGYTDEAVVTDAEVTAVIAWCREWVADCEWINMSTATLLRCCNRHVVGGLAFVLADVRLCATPANRELAEWGTLADSAASLAARRCELAREGDPAAFEPVDALQSRADELNEDASMRAAIIERADAVGYEAGVAAGSWVIDGNTDAEDAASLLRMIEDGDPAAYDALPSSPLSGEWADGTTPRDVLEDLGVEDEEENYDLLDHWERGYDRGVMDEVVRSCRAAITNTYTFDHGEEERYAWPGGYERFAITSDGAVLCISCVNDPTNPIHEDEPDDGWRIAGWSHEGDDDGEVTCDHCGRVIVEDEDALKCPECGEEVWDVPNGSKLAKCWNTEGHADGGTLAFDTMDDDEPCDCGEVVGEHGGYVAHDPGEYPTCGDVVARKEREYEAIHGTREEQAREQYETDRDAPEVVYVACSCCGHVVTADAERMPRDCENCYAASLRTFAELEAAEAYSEHVLGDGRA